MLLLAFPLLLVPDRCGSCCAMRLTGFPLKTITFHAFACFSLAFGGSVQKLLMVMANRLPLKNLDFSCFCLLFLAFGGSVRKLQLGYGLTGFPLKTLASHAVCDAFPCLVDRCGSCYGGTNRLPFKNFTFHAFACFSCFWWIVAEAAKGYGLTGFPLKTLRFMLLLAFPCFWWCSVSEAAVVLTGFLLKTLLFMLLLAFLCFWWNLGFRVKCC